MKNYSVKNKNYCVNNEKYCVNKLMYCVNNFGFDIQPFGCAQLASPQGSLHFVNPYPDLCNLQGNAQETELFFYHPDHLGSTGMVTDNSSIISQGFLYAPFGEIISEYTPGWETDRISKYAFNAKELDEENNMYYYSARYYAPPTFISRDPMFEKYPSISPYTYCANNPVIYVDPTGLFRKESNANKARIYAMEKMKNCTVGEVYQTEKGRYEFIITKNDKYKSLNDGNVSSEGGTLNTLIVYGDKGKRIRSNIGLLFYSKFGINFDGIFGTSDKGQGKETKRGDGETINLDQFTDPVPKPIINENGTTTPPSNENKEESKNYEGTDGYFNVIVKDPVHGDHSEHHKYFGSEDSINQRNAIKDNPKKHIIETIITKE